MPKIAFVGAGSAVFTRNLVGDALSLPELRDDTTFALMDIDAERLRTSEIVTRRLVEAHGAGALERRAAILRGGHRGAGAVRLHQAGGSRSPTCAAARHRCPSARTSCRRAARGGSGRRRRGCG